MNSNVTSSINEDDLLNSTFTIDTSSLTSPSCSITIPTGSYTYSGGPYTIATTGYSTPWATLSNGANGTSASLDVTGDANFNGDIKVKGKSLTEFMETLEKRLAILQPDPAKLEKFEALKKAYDHYKLLEALCHEDDNGK